MSRNPAFCIVAFLLTSAISSARNETLPGYVVHFDFISSEQQGRDLVRIAARGGAKVINVVPPAHIWESPISVQMLDGILDEIAREKLSFVITRIDGAFPPDADGDRFSYLYGRILAERGRMPDGKETDNYFLTTVGRDGYDEWMEEETRYYARHYANRPNLLGIDLGPFSEPFTSQRGSFLQYSADTRFYELAQYTPSALKVWHRWLAGHFAGTAELNRDYGSAFQSVEEVPLPRSETDPKFGAPQIAYFDFVRSINDWFVERYETCRRIWHEEGGNTTVPFILQFNGGLAEKMALGRPSFAAFDVTDWIDRADALGLSIYTNNGFQDFGHASVRATVNLVAEARSRGKDVFVLEGGCESPNVILNAGELAFFGSSAAKLDPRTYIYEFLKDKFDELFASNPGKPVAADGRIRRPAYNALRRLFSEIESRPAVKDSPMLYLAAEPLAARGNAKAGAINAAAYDLAADAPIRFVPTQLVGRTRLEAPVLRLDGSVTPPNEALSQLMRNIPLKVSKERPAWRLAALRAIKHGRK